MDWKPAVATNDAKIKEIEQHLIEIGFPEAILADLTEEDIKACEGALRIAIEVKTHPINEGRIVREETAAGMWEHIVYDQEELKFTHIAVELPEERERWKVFHHFEFIIHPYFYGTESIQLWSCYRNLPYAWALEGEVSGQVLYDLDSQTFVAPYASLKEENYETQSILPIGTTRNTDVFADFSMPNDGGRHRGYLSYTTEKIQDGVILDSWVNYTHQNSWLQYPVLTATEKRIQNSFAQMEPFKTVHDALQFYPFQDGIED